MGKNACELRKHPSITRTRRPAAARLALVEPAMSEASGGDPVVLTERAEDGVQIIRLNRPKVLNAFNDELLLALGGAIRQADANSEIRSVIITGEGGAFCSGADIKSPWDIETAIHGLRRRLNPVLLAMDDLHKPLIAAIDGVVAGAGLGFIGVADARVATRRSRFVPATVKLGIVPDGGITYFVPRLIGQGRAFRWLCGGEHIDADTAAEWGLVDEVTDEPGLDRALALARMFGSAPGASVPLTKQLLRRSPHQSLAEQLESEQRFQDLAQAHPFHGR
jgi:2-(1,2-epoxy-1,2-dihydrophenyl)acetyl-CoA isomerase